VEAEISPRNTVTTSIYIYYFALSSFLESCTTALSTCAGAPFDISAKNPRTSASLTTVPVSANPWRKVFNFEDKV